MKSIRNIQIGRWPVLRVCMSFVFLLLPLLFTSCNLINPAGLPSTVVVHSVGPSATQSGMSDSFGNHVAGYDSARSKTGYLVLMLSGTGGNPTNYKRFLTVPLLKGHHVISLAYPNTTAVGQIAQNDLNAYGPLRQEIMYGDDASSLISVPAVDAIVNRLSKLLQHLHTTYPNEGWDGFLSGELPLWEKIIVAGYSQGAGHAAYLAATQNLARAIMFSGVVDGRVADPRESATWISSATNAPLWPTASGWTTSLQKLYFFVSIHDGFYPSIRANLTKLGFNPDSAPMVDGTESPLPLRNLYLCQTILGAEAHPSTIEDQATPLKLDGTPLYKTVWEKLFE